MLKAPGWLQHFSAVAVQRLLHLKRSVVTSVLCTDLPLYFTGNGSKRAGISEAIAGHDAGLNQHHIVQAKVRIPQAYCPHIIRMAGVMQTCSDDIASGASVMLFKHVQEPETCPLIPASTPPPANLRNRTMTGKVTR